MPWLSGVDLVFTSPPYNLGMHPSGSGSGMHAGSLAAADLAGGYGTYRDAMPQDEYDEWQTDCVTAMWLTLSGSGAIFYNHKPRPFNGELKLPLQYGRGLPLRQIIVWDRGTGMNFSTSHFLPKYEWILIWAKNAWALSSKEASGIGDVWRVRPEVDDAHPAAFPKGLPARAIEATGGELLLDPFMGSGTTIRAAKDAGRRAIGIDVDERFCEIAATRCAQEVLAL
jgi:DNA modification methylase